MVPSYGKHRSQKIRAMYTFRELLYACGVTLGLVILFSQDADSRKEHPSLTLRRLQDAVYDLRWQEYPEYATFAGVHKYDDSLQSYTLESFKRRKDNCEDILRQANDLEVGYLTPDEKRELKILKSFLSTYIEGYKWKDYGSLNPVNFLEGISKGIHWTYYSKFKTKDDFEKYLQRLAAFPAQIDEQISLMRRAILLKRTLHKASVDRVPDVLKEWQVEMSFLYPLETALQYGKFPEDVRDLILEKAEESLPAIKAAMKRLHKFLSEDYLNATRPVEGVHILPNGNQYYRACLKWYLGVDITPEEIFELGVKEVDRIERQMNRVMESVDFHGDLKSFFKYVKYIPKFYNHTKEQLIHRYKHLIFRKIQPRLQFMFRNISLPPISVVPVDNDGPWGTYGQNVFYVNLKEPRKRSTFTMLPLALHETDPGHHFQDAYANIHKIPKYRHQSLTSQLYSVPFHFPIYGAYAEGWALYAEYLGEEMGLYDSPYDLFGRYCSEILRACRLVIDTGIHAFGWSRDQAIKFLSNYSDFPTSQIEGEIDRYITWPGQACTYKIGEIKIKKLRHQAEVQLGNRFNIREFHHVVLKLGGVPLKILEEEIYMWIRSQLEMGTRGVASTMPVFSPASTFSNSTYLSFLLLTVILWICR